MEAASRLFEPGADRHDLGLHPPGWLPTAIDRLASKARSAGMRVALDASGEPLRLALDAQPEIVKVNADEAAAVLGAAAGDRDGTAGCRGGAPRPCRRRSGTSASSPGARTG